MDGSTRRHGRSRRREDRLAWGLLLLAVLGPALALGGVPPVCVALCLPLYAGLWARVVCRGGTLRIPWAAALGLGLCAATLVQWIPMPAVVRALLSPELSARVHEAALGGEWGSLSPSPGDTGLEVPRLFALLLLFVAAAQLPWRVSTGAVVLTSVVVAVIGLTQGAFGVHAIYGLYHPVDVNPAETPALLTSFVNPNHQSGLLLLGVFGAAALALDASQRARGSSARDGVTSRDHGRAREQAIAGLIALLIQSVALVLSRSRAAVVAALLIAPLAMWFAWAGQPRAPRSWRARVALAAAFVALLCVVASRGAGEELASIFSTGSAGKLRVVRDALALVSVSPWVGIGRGAFMDVFPAYDSQPGVVVHTHLESAPAVMVVEWGVAAGACAVIGFAIFWLDALRRSRLAHSARARRVALCGLLALTAQNLGDFSLEFLGVAAPACALAGAFAPGRLWRWSPSRRQVGAVLVIVALLEVLALWAVPRSWTRREQSDALVRAGDPAAIRDALRVRPLDATLHEVLARGAGTRGAWDEARLHARVAASQRPGSADAWLLLAAAESSAGRSSSARDAVARALEVVDVPIEPTVVDYLLARYPDPKSLSPLLPLDGTQWFAVVESIGARDPVYGGALVALRGLGARSPELLALQATLALAAENSALALHAARLLRARAPQDVRGPTLMVRALRGFPRSREREIQRVLEDALASGQFDAPAVRGVLEELLVQSWMSSGAPRDLERARALMETLARRPGTRAQQRARQALRVELDARRTPE